MIRPHRSLLGRLLAPAIYGACAGIDLVIFARRLGRARAARKARHSRNT